MLGEFVMTFAFVQRFSLKIVVSFFLNNFRNPIQKENKAKLEKEKNHECIHC